MSPAPSAHRQGFIDRLTCLALIVATLMVYVQAAGFDFVNLDDDSLVTRNSHVVNGVSPANIRWAVTAQAVGNWMPLTLLSHMLDAQLFGLRSGMHHLTNVLLHALSAALLFLLLRRSTHAWAPSAFVAAIFALHPLHVESVAWIAERKDVLSGVFFFLALYAYVCYAERPGVWRYLMVVLPFCLGLMAKSMLVTFPFVLLLFDVWPLRRAWSRQVVWEKLPLLALSVLASMVAYVTQRSAGAVAVTASLGARAENALLSYLTYIRQTFWPAGLAVYYPYPRGIGAIPAGAALLVLLFVSVIAALGWRKRPYLATGWFWYLGMLVPVIGLVRIGEQSHADRYTYLPMVGLLLIVAWGAADLVESRPGTRFIVAAMAALSCLVCTGLTWKQAGYWRNSETLFQHALDVTGPDNWLAQSCLGEYLLHIPERRADAVDHLENAVRLEPDYFPAQTNLGFALAEAQLCDAAIPHFEAALRLSPGEVSARNNFAICLEQTGNYGGAIDQLEASLRLQPDQGAVHVELAGAHRQLGRLLMRLGRTGEAILQLESAQRIQPDRETAGIIAALRNGQRVVH